MRWSRFRRWWRVALNVGTALGVMIFAFWPCSRTAREQSVRSQRLSGALDVQIDLIEGLPKQRSDLDALQGRLQRFMSELSGTDEVGLAMSHLRERAEAARLQLWTLNPSVPVLIQLDLEGDSLARLDLAVLPVAFECRGSFADVARFLSQSESRADFYRWTSLSMTADPQSSGVQAKAEFRLFLLPPTSALEAQT